MLNLAIRPESQVPPFEQLRAQLASMAASGELAPGARLPTVRQLAADLGLAANTVARTYRELEADGVVATHGRRGTFVHSGRDAPATVTQLAADFARAARRAGLTAPEAVQLIERAWRAA